MDDFEQRRRRVTLWLGREVPAKAMLELYLHILDLQAPLFRQVRSQPPLPVLATVERALKQADFRRFARDLALAGTEVIARTGQVLGVAEPLLSNGLVAACLTREDPQPIAERLGLAVAPAVFFARAYLEPLAQASDAPEGELEEDGVGLCPRCAWPPRASLLRDEPEIQGRRFLECALCSTRWPFPRATCAHCSEARSSKLRIHVTDSLPHLRVESCDTCRRYLKTFDLRLDGRTVPVVDDLATVELDLWAGEEGLVRVEPGLLG